MLLESIPSGFAPSPPPPLSERQALDSPLIAVEDPPFLRSEGQGYEHTEHQAANQASSD